MAMMEALLKIRADVQGEGKINALGKALGGLDQTAKGVGSGLSGLAGKLGGLGGALGSLAGLATGAGLAALAKNAIDTADNLRDMSLRTGVSVEQLSKLKTAAEMSGATIDDVGKALTKTAAAIANAPSEAANAASNALAAGTSNLKQSIEQQVQLIQKREEQQIAAIKSGAERQIAEVHDRERRQIDAIRTSSDRAVDLVKEGERKQVDAIDRAAEQRINRLERETDARLREISRRYRQEEKLLNDSYDDQRDLVQQAADDSQRTLERDIEKRYAIKEKAINADKTLSDANREAALELLRGQQGDELDILQDRFKAEARARDRQFRDQQEREQQAIEDRRRKEEDAEKARLEALKRQAQERAMAEKDAIARASAEQQAAIKRDAAEQERAIKARNEAAIKLIKANAEAMVKAIQDGNKRSQDAYAKLGIALRNLDGSQRKPGEVFMDLFDALQKLPTQMDRTAAVIDVFGAKLGPKLAPMFAMTRDEVEKLSATITTQFADAADRFNDKQTEISNSLLKLGTGIGEIFLPLIDGLANVIGGLVDFLNSLPEPVKRFLKVMADIGIVVIPLAKALAFLSTLQLGATIAGWLGAVGPAVAGITAAFTGLLAWLSGTLVPALIGIFSGPVGWTVLAVAAVVAMAIAFREPLLKFLAWFGDSFMQGLQVFGALLYDVFVQPWIDLWNNVLKQPVTSLLSWLSGVFDWTFKALYAIVWQLLVQPWINIWNSVLREPVLGAITWVTEAMTAIGAVMQTGLIALGRVAYDVFVKPWVDLWQNVFRQPVIGAISWLSSAWASVSRGFSLYVVQPIVQAWNAMLQLLPQAMRRAVQFVQNAWTGMINTIRNALRGFLISIANGINSVVKAVNKVIAGFNNLPGPDVPFVPGISVPAFAEGGYVKRPTVGLVGEAGAEYIIPERKMARASAAYLAGSRGAKVLSTVNRAAPAATVTAAGGDVTINVRTGPVMEFQGERYVKVEDLDRAMRATADGVISRLRTPSARIALGIR